MLWGIVAILWVLMCRWEVATHVHRHITKGHPKVIMAAIPTLLRMDRLQPSVGVIWMIDEIM